MILLQNSERTWYDILIVGAKSRDGYILSEPFIIGEDGFVNVNFGKLEKDAPFIIRGKDPVKNLYKIYCIFFEKSRLHKNTKHNFIYFIDWFEKYYETINLELFKKRIFNKRNYRIGKI